MSGTLERLTQERLLAPIHRALVDMLRRIDPGANPHVLLAATLVSEQNSRGHVCLDLKSLDNPEMRDLLPEVAVDGEHPDWPELAEWVVSLEGSLLVTVIDGELDAAAFASSSLRPLVFDCQMQRVYFARAWYCEQSIARHLAQRLKHPPLTIDRQRLADDLKLLFPDGEKETGRDQCQAAARALTRSLAVITGGPGTGKTTTVARLIALRLLQPSANAERSLRIMLLAPTGKAAQRLKESLERVSQTLNVPDSVRAELHSVKTGTIHRLLGWSPKPPEDGGPFQHRAEHPLPADIVLVDESSMVDLELLYHLVNAVAPETQLILMGDRNQLVSVEAGSAFGDLCSAIDAPESRSVVEPTAGRKTRSRATKAASTQPSLFPVEGDELKQCVSVLRYSHRFSADSVLGQFASAIRDGLEDEAVRILRSASPDEILWLWADDPLRVAEEVTRRAAQECHSYLNLLQRTPTGSVEILRALNRVRVLCAHRGGLHGEESLNRRIADQLMREGMLRPSFGFYFGQPLMVVENNQRMELFNGDTGVVVQHPQRDGLAVLLDDPGNGAGVRHLPLALMPGNTTSFAMTIHKSQGSEFSRVFVVLPVEDSPILSRELLYTAITRVRSDTDSGGKTQPGFLLLAGTEEVIRSAVRRRVQRTGGLRDAVESLLR